jgi:hypothetical protein
LKFEDAIENEKKPTKELLDETIKDLKIVIEKLDDDVYQNYLGYLLIDYDVDIKYGIKLIKDALKKQPDSLAYLDSLAWGYFKDNRCAEAFDITKKIKEKDDKIILEHINQIKKCYEKTLKSKTLREQIK